jgi:hypothetical protein
MLIDKLFETMTADVGHQSWSTGFTPTRTSLFDEVRRRPEAVCNFLMNRKEWDLATWVMDHFIRAKT